MCASELMAGDYQEAYSYAQQASVLAAELDDQLMIGVALSYVGFAQLCLGQQAADQGLDAVSGQVLEVAWDSRELKISN